MFSNYWILAIIVIGIAATIGWTWQKRIRYQPLKSVPSPPRHWLLGNIPQVSAAIKKKQFFKLLFDWSQQYGPVYVLWSAQPILVLSQPTVIEETIVNGMRDGSLARSKTASEAWNEISGPILLGTSGSEWKWRRKAWNPEFSASGLAPYISVVQPACSQVIEALKAAGPSEKVQIDALFVELTMRVIANLLLGIPVDSRAANSTGQPLDVPKFYQAMSVLGYRFLRVATGEKSWKKYLPLKSSREYWAARRYLEDFLTPYVDSALRFRSESIEGGPAPMLAKIAAKESRYTRETLIAESIELLIAGTDTTAHSLSFAVGELALHPEVLQKAQAVVDQVWQKYGAFSLDSLKDLSYIRAIFKETLRLYSVASGSTSLETTRQTTIQDITVPPDTKVFWSMLGAGRDPSTYSEPDKFRPERWLENGKELHSLPMIDFGSGSHRCLGEHLAMLEATIMLAQLLHSFTWKLVNGRASLENLQQNLLIYPADGMPVQMEARVAVPSVA
ncbi:MAG: cytochrome P450 [Phormidesmis sp.]